MTNEELLDLYQDLRVADVRDGMDWNLLHAQGSMHPDIRPTGRLRKDRKHRTPTPIEN